MSVVKETKLVSTVNYAGQSISTADERRWCRTADADHAVHTTTEQFLCVGLVARMRVVGESKSHQSSKNATSRVAWRQQTNTRRGDHPRPGRAALIRGARHPTRMIGTTHGGLESTSVAIATSRANYYLLFLRAFPSSKFFLFEIEFSKFSFHREYADCDLSEHTELLKKHRTRLSGLIFARSDRN